MKLYAKALELEHRARTKPILSDYFKELADHARNTVRFEVSFRQVRALRRFWDIEDGRLPTLALMCDPNTVRLALATEAQRMRLYEDTYESLSTESYAQRIRQIGATIRSIKERLASGDLKRCGRRKSLTPQRIMNLVAAYSLLTAYSPGELTQQFGFSKSKVNELRRDLREIGLQADSSSTGTLAESVQELAERLRPFVFAPRVPDWWDASSFVDAPWGDAEEGDNENDETNIATVSSGEVNLSGSDEELAIRAILASL